MAVYDLEEQEQLDDLKAWWTRWGNTVAGVVIAAVRRHRRRAGLALVTAAAGRGARRCSTARSATRARANDVAKAKDAMAQLADKYARHRATRRARRCSYAKHAVRQRRQGRREGAAAVGGRPCGRRRAEGRSRAFASPRSCSTRSSTTRRCARSTRRRRRVRGLYADLRGDVLAAAGRDAEARTAYQTALAKLDPKSPYRNYVQVKLDALGGAVHRRSGCGADRRLRRPAHRAAADTAPPAAPAHAAAGEARRAAPRRAASDAGCADARRAGLRGRRGGAAAAARRAESSLTSWLPTIPPPSFAGCSAARRSPARCPTLNADGHAADQLAGQRRQGGAGLRTRGHGRSRSTPRRPTARSMRVDPATGRAVWRSQRGRERSRPARAPMRRSSSSAPTRATCSRSTPTASRCGRRSVSSEVDRAAAGRRRRRRRVRPATAASTASPPPTARRKWVYQRTQSAADGAQLRGRRRSAAAACSSARPAASCWRSTSPPARRLGSAPSRRRRARPSSSASPTSQPAAGRRARRCARSPTRAASRASTSLRGTLQLVARRRRASRASPPTRSNLYVTDDKGAVQALDKTTGASVWKQDKLADAAASAGRSSSATTSASSTSRATCTCSSRTDGALRRPHRHRRHAPPRRSRRARRRAPSGNRRAATLYAVSAR